MKDRFRRFFSVDFFSAYLGVGLGFLSLSLFWISVFLLLILGLKRSRWAVCLVFAVLSRLVAVFGDRFADRIGLNLLSSSFLQPIWLQFSNMPIIPWTRFDNSVVLGYLVILGVSGVGGSVFLFFKGRRGT